MSLARFYGSPMIFAYDPFFGYFSGTLYDTVVDVRPELWTYRGGIARDARGRRARRRRAVRDARRQALARARLRRRRTRGAAIAAASGSPGVVRARGEPRHHARRARRSATGRPRRRSPTPSAGGPRARAATSSTPTRSRPTRRRCSSATASKSWPPTSCGSARTSTGRLTAFVFADADEKRRLMGAADTSIAKPWRREVYVQLAAYPAPRARPRDRARRRRAASRAGPSASGAGGWLPNPGLIEGVAVATSPDDDELTDGQWARAMLDLGTLPEIRGLFSLEFLGVSAQKSYTVAGAFVGWVLDRWGAGVVRAWYGGGLARGAHGRAGPRSRPTSAPGSRALPMPPRRDGRTRARSSSGPSVWARRCPHVVDALDRDGDQCRDEHRFARADALYAQALARDPRD